MANRETVIEIESVNTEIKTKKPTFELIYFSTLSKVKQKVSAISIRPSTLHLIIKYVMEEVEETQAKGAEQKEIALKLIRALVIDLTEGADEEVLLKLLDDNTVSNLIDLIVDATKGKLNINAVTKVGSGCVNTCVPYWFK
jgi:hypothetical protein|tara:strand:+ start:333 stop:755 length:423 start_codon:yes stop_codon:yes gene_type:complete